MNHADDSPFPISEPSERQNTERAFQHLLQLVKQARPYLPGDFCGELILAMFEYSEAQLEVYKRDLFEAEFGGRGPETSRCR